MCKDKQVNQCRSRRDVIESNWDCKRIDDLGRVVIPKEIRRTCELEKEILWKSSQTVKAKSYLKSIPQLAS